MNKQIRNKQKTPGSGTIQFQSCCKFWCYSSSIQSFCWYLSRSSVIGSPGVWLAGSFFFFCLSAAAAWSSLPSVRCGCLVYMLSSGSGDQLCSLPAVLFWSWLFSVLVYWGLVSLLHPFLWSKVSDLSAGPLLSVYCDG
jgi:hypothetical protein